MGELQMAIADARRSRDDVTQRASTDFGRDKAWQLLDQERCASPVLSRLSNSRSVPVPASDADTHTVLHVDGTRTLSSYIILIYLYL